MKRLLATALVMIALVGTLSGQDTVRIKLGTLAPKDSSPHEAMKLMAEQWRQASDGKVTLTIFTDGTQGGEAEMVRRMKIGQLQAAMLSGVGLAEIEPAVTALQTMPLVYRNFAELDYVREKLRPKLEAQIAAKGFVMLFWADAGWVRFFSRRPALFPDDFRKQKVFLWAGDSKTLELMRSAGYQPVPLETADILPALKTGLIDVIPAPPFMALAAQYYESAPHMLEMNWAPLVGGLVLTQKTWERIPTAVRPQLRAVAERTGAAVCQQLRQEMDEAVAAMVKRRLVVQRLTPEAEAAWQQLAREVYPKIRGNLVPADMFDEVQRLLAEYRATGTP